MKNFWNFLRSKVFLINIGLAFLVIIILSVLILQWLKKSTKHGEFVMVPDLAKLSVMEMRDVIEDANLRYEVLDSANYDPEYPRFSIIEQDPPAGNKVKENRKIYITVNPSGYKKVTVPNVIQVTQRNAGSMLRAVGLDVERITYIDELGKDMVYYIRHKGKTINPGDKLPKTSKIELVCGNGTITERAKVKVDSE
ncbi:PASTA domain-containing protein [uncultured Eudoraea sp.]|uniref:PASTA domain-containing protein n=1 Tax=uncultured Eudoraea sp. TaxID=1035614 RepID=UPI0026061B09|nr:PASTA domain-containing protein [uncultured Eudoraea sp.]